MIAGHTPQFDDRVMQAVTADEFEPRTRRRQIPGRDQQSLDARVAYLESADQSGFQEVWSIADRDDPTVPHEHRVPEHAGWGSNCACGDEPGTHRWFPSQRR